jgi:hypothetical protein
MIYQVAVGNQSKLYEHCIQSVTRYCEKHNITQIVQRTPILRIKPDVFTTNRSVESYEKHGGFLPIYEKENAFDYFDTFDQIAIVDADIYIRDSAIDVFDAFGKTHEFGAVVERDAPITPQYKNKLLGYTRMQYSPLTDVDWEWNESGAKFYNMGFMIMNKTFSKYLKGQSPREFIERPEFKRFVDGEGAWKWSTDQTLLNWFIKKERVRVKDMSWHFNALYTAVEDITPAHFVHFFLKDKLPEKGENVEELMKAIG